MISLTLITFKSAALIIAGIFNLILGGVVLAKATKDLGNKAFFAISVGVFLWAISHSIFEILPTGSTFLLSVGHILYISAALIPVSFLLFATFWGSDDQNMKMSLYLPALSFIVIVTFVVLPNFIIKSVILDKGIKTILFGSGYIIYALYIVGVFLFAFYKIVQKYRVATGMLKIQTMYVLFGTAVASLIGVITNLLLPMYGSFYLFWVGPTMTVIMVAVIGYAILKHQLFDIKLIIVEMAILLLNLFLFLNVFTSHEKTDLILNVSVSAFILAFSIVLIRGIYKDIRDRERIEGLVKDMEVANEKLRMLEGQKTEFVSIASHQLRTPLTVIKGYASMILEGTFGHINDQARDAMEKLYKSSERIVALVEDLLTVSRIEQGRMMLNFERVNFKDFIQGVIGEMENEISESKIDMSFTAEEEKEFFVSIDEKKFKQVVKHILENAIKYTPEPGSVRVAVLDDSLTKKVRLTVSDTGIGMTQEQVTAIFERFNLKAEVGGHATFDEKHLTQEEEQKKNDDAEAKMMEKRTPGIGLYIVQEIVEAHHGTLRIESAGTDRGTTVVVELPKGE
ncbi:MAG: Signal transduction histidine kinase [Parcubacteria group bacterium GW2011_GWA1_44_13]|uniref:histidine kinase n=1 Tax=Candidatus Nomurabacteria bacterium GW2011_GWB1_44_12 TaxID=1618748 RepID=A0A837IAT0_9BACT|nr:MAG: Signal transduction histidine kinase [Candidatus Nomurabacteria bacterium GW2011_GWB1_44_12]KKT38565.1 MAG: Signal transduction histidine kinase [Parcubacteria group bacterium GW2011_GWA1_44_13]KKT60965.1 MAG: PAS/PAC sensor signal transduction histidine kinase [Parcubacteria group bacterium GW2011_GWC1_44_26]HBB44437.1 hypothetical protein [Candidatus Yonathbacteria bacterium]